jgi:hypothetical protein
MPDLSVHPTDDGHQPVGETIPDLNVRPTDEHQAEREAIPDLNVRPTDEHQANRAAIPYLNAQPADIAQLADGDATFDVPDQQDDFDLNVLFPVQHEGRQQSMISNLHYSSLFSIIMHNNFIFHQ